MMDMPFSVKCCLLSRIFQNYCRFVMFICLVKILCCLFCKPEIDVINWKLDWILRFIYFYLFFYFYFFFIIYLFIYLLGDRPLSELSEGYGNINHI